MMMYYEIKKIFVKRGNRVALAVLAFAIIVIVYSLVSQTYWVNENGEMETGFGTIRKIKEAKQEWSGSLTENQIARVIEEKNRINATPQHQSEDMRQQEIAYSWTQGFQDITYLLNYAYGDFQTWDYTVADSLTPDMASDFYPNRMKSLKKWLEEEEGGANLFTDKEKAFLMEQYENLETPFFYEYQEGWKNLFQWASGIAMITALVLGFLCAGIFADEFRQKASAIFYSSYHGRGKAIWTKVTAGLLTVTAVYWAAMLAYSAAVLGIFGIEGSNCPIQSTMVGWKSFYQITNGQEYLMILFGGYLGCLFMTGAVMLVSAAAKSSLLAVTIPFLMIILPSLLMSMNSPTLNKILGLLPDQLLQISSVVKYFNLYEIGGEIFGAVPILAAVYLLLTFILIPMMYFTYKKHQVTR